MYHGVVWWWVVRWGNKLSAAGHELCRTTTTPTPTTAAAYTFVSYPYINHDQCNCSAVPSVRLCRKSTLWGDNSSRSSFTRSFHMLRSYEYCRCSYVRSVLLLLLLCRCLACGCPERKPQACFNKNRRTTRAHASIDQVGRLAGKRTLHAALAA